MIKHGLATKGNKHPIYKLWERIKCRCYTTNFPRDVKNYKNKGIIMCDEWKNNAANFYDWCINNGWKLGLSIDRINNTGNYEPSNCQFLTISENSKKLWRDSPNLNRGINSKHTTLTNDNVANIKKLLSMGESCSRISHIMNVSYHVVYKIKINATWRHIPQPSQSGSVME